MITHGTYNICSAWILDTRISTCCYTNVATYVVKIVFDTGAAEATFDRSSHISIVIKDRSKF